MSRVLLGLLALPCRADLTNTQEQVNRYVQVVTTLQAAVRINDTNAITTNLVARLVDTGDELGAAFDVAQYLISAAYPFGAMDSGIQEALEQGEEAQSHISMVRLGLGGWLWDPGGEQAPYLDSISNCVKNVAAAGRKLDVLLAGMDPAAVGPYLRLYLQADERFLAEAVLRALVRVRNVGLAAAEGVRLLVTFGHDPGARQGRIPIGTIEPGDEFEHVLNIPAGTNTYLDVTLEVDGMNCEGDFGNISARMVQP